MFIIIITYNDYLAFTLLIPQCMHALQKVIRNFFCHLSFCQDTVYLLLNNAIVAYHSASHRGIINLHLREHADIKLGAICTCPHTTYLIIIPLITTVVAW